MIFDKIEDLIVKNWGGIYSECNTVSESIDKVMRLLNEEEVNFVLENWNYFFDMVSDSYHHGLSINYLLVYESMETVDLEKRKHQHELLNQIVEHIILETKLGLPPHESWEGFFEGGFGEDVVQYGIKNLNLIRKNLIEEYFDRGYELFELFHSDVKLQYYESQFEDEED